MKWSREKDYHGYRSYSDDATGRSGEGLLAGLIAALRSAVQFIAKPTPPAVALKKGGRSGYSTLGTSSGRLRRPAECPFPTEAGNATPASRR